MTVFDKLYVSSYKYFTKRDGSGMRINAALMVCIFQLFCLGFPLIFIQTVTQNFFMSFLHASNKLYYLPFVAICMAFNVFYYNTERTKNLVGIYNEMPKEKQKFW